MKKRIKLMICATVAVIVLVFFSLYSGTNSNRITIDTIDDLYSTKFKQFGFQYELLNLSDPFDHNTAVKLYGQISSPYEPAWVEVYAIQKSREEFEQLINKQIPMNALQKKISINDCEYVCKVFENRQPLNKKITYALRIKNEACSFGLLFTFNLLKIDDLDSEQKCINSILKFVEDSLIIK